MTISKISETEAYAEPVVGDHFETIESAHQYIQLLGQVVSDVRKDLESEASCEKESQIHRRQDAIRLALYNLDKLRLHMKAASRILNDLRSLRRLLLEERQESLSAALPRNLAISEASIRR